jgi:hypothetical protein
LRPESHRTAQLGRPKLFETPFNASELAPVKVMLEHVDEGLDIAAYTPELADGLDNGRALSAGTVCSRCRAPPRRASVAAISSA